MCGIFFYLRSSSLDMAGLWLLISHPGALQFFSGTSIPLLQILTFINPHLCYIQPRKILPVYNSEQKSTWDVLISFQSEENSCRWTLYSPILRNDKKNVQNIDLMGTIPREAKFFAYYKTINFFSKKNAPLKSYPTSHTGHFREKCITCKNHKIFWINFVSCLSD
jgi:hypothetical protein